MFRGRRESPRRSRYFVGAGLIGRGHWHRCLQTRFAGRSGCGDWPRDVGARG